MIDPVGVFPPVPEFEGMSGAGYCATTQYPRGRFHWVMAGTALCSALWPGW